MKITVEITPSQIENLIVSALEGGSNYWYEIKKFHKPRLFEHRTDPKQLFKHVDYPMNPGGYLEIGSLEEPERPTANLNLESIERGLQLMASSKEYAHHFTDILKDDDDATTGDVFLQFALYGEVLYR